jgi:NTP pyrophosphatase (non-canonical NTP hydrolase)
MNTHQELTVYIAEQNKNRRLWSEGDTPEVLIDMLGEETEELKIAVQEAMITGDVFSVASEIGDIQYLLLKLGEMIDIDPLQAAEMKLVRNSYKYSDHISSNGRTQETARQVIKDTWKGLGGDYSFSHVYLNYLAEDDTVKTSAVVR